MKSARPAMRAKDNQKQIMILTTSSTEGDMCNDALKLSISVFVTKMCKLFFTNM